MWLLRRVDAARLGILLCAALYATASFAVPVTVHGHISELATAQPIAGAVVRVFERSSDTTPIASVQTVADGSYLWQGDLSPGAGMASVVEASAPGHSTEQSSFDPSLEDVEIDLALQSAIVFGVVRDLADKPLPNVAVKALSRAAGSSQWTVTRTVATAADGTYTFDTLPRETYRICAGGLSYGFVQECYDGVRVSLLTDIDGATPLVLGDGLTRDDIDFRLTAGATFVGSVSDKRSNDPIPNIQVAFELYDANGSLLDTGAEQADATGRYTLRGVPSGAFRIAARALSGGFGGKQLYSGIDCITSACAPITAGDVVHATEGGSVAGIDFSFGPEGLIRGRITDAVDGTPVSSVSMWACYNDTFIHTTHCNYQATSDTDGRYELIVNVRTYFVQANASADYVDQVYPNMSCVGRSCNEGGGNVVVQAGDRIEGIDFSLRRSATLAGRVLDTSTGLPIAAAQIVGYDSDYVERWSVRTDAEGRYVGGKWLPGTHYVRAWYGSWPLISCAFYLDRLCPNEGDPISLIDPTPVVLTTGQHRSDIDFSLTNPLIFANGFEPSVTH